MSKSSLNKFFQKQLNTTCHQYILKKRLALAVSLIRQDVPLKTVAVQSGFGDYSSFFRAFKKMYHISPTECQADNEKLKKIKPRTLGEALNISGVTPAAISILLVYLKRYRGKKE